MVVLRMANAAEAEWGDQTEVIAFLSDPTSYPGRLEKVERCETHAALVFLAGHEAWKIKRAVRFPYMDFCTLEKRRDVCFREVEINRGLAPEIYLGCVPITRQNDGRLALGGDGEVVEWAVQMRRFDQAALLSNLAEARGIGAELAKTLADRVFDSHQAAARAAHAAGRERIADLVASVSGGLAALGEELPHADTVQFAVRAREQTDCVGGVLDRRADKGFVRRCHGDLHLRNIVLWRGHPVLFDAIEFDEDLATIDTLYDLAFLLMDLDIRGQRLAANVILNRYLWRSGDPLDLEGLAALPLFLGLRAAIRAMVTAQRARQEPGAAAGRDAESARGRARLSRARCAEADCRRRAFRHGQVDLATALAPDTGPVPGAVHLQSDLERKSLFGVGAIERLAPEHYTQVTSAEVYDILYRKARTALGAGHAVIVDAGFGKPEERAAIEAVAAEVGWHVPPGHGRASGATRTGSALAR
jgi:uncharacterized protein